MSVRPEDRGGERGSALVIAVLVTVILALLGISFLLMSETESRIAQNEKLTAQALYAAEAGARAVKRWFDHPQTALGFPAPEDVELAQREIIDETDPYDPADATPADGVIGSFPYYKQGVDLDGDTDVDLFQRPFRGGSLHGLMGTESGPDILIDASDAEGAVFLDDLSARLLDDFPQEPGLAARISRIAVFAPPYVKVGANWSRYGVATVRVSAQIQRERDGEVLAERSIRTVLSEVPYYGVYGPLHSCGALTFTGDPISVYWGVMTAELDTTISGAAAVAESLPRELPAVPRGDPVLTNFDLRAYAVEMDAHLVDDPWFRLLSGGAVNLLPAADQPYPTPWDNWFPPDPVPPGGCCGHSNVVHRVPIAGCPDYDYGVWKAIAAAGFSDVRYYAWTAAGFAENGVGVARTFEDITNGQEGVYFFDSIDRLAPHDDDGDGRFDNLTPPISVSGVWSFRGMLYLNAESFQLDGVIGGATTFNAPGEPYQDLDQDGTWGAAEPWLDLDYPTMAATMDGPYTIVGGGADREARGPDVADSAAIHGILYTNGHFEATGSGRVYGSVVARQGVVQAISDGSAPTPEIFWDQTLDTGWPPPGWNLPRVAITAMTAGD